MQYTREVGFEAISFSKTNFWSCFLSVVSRGLVWIGIACLPAMIFLLCGAAIFFVDEAVGGAFLLLTMVPFFIVVFAVLQFVGATVYLEKARGTELPLIIRPQLKTLWRFFLCGCISLLILIPAYLFFVLPGIILRQRLRLAFIFVLDGMGPIASLEKSWAITRPATWDLVALSFFIFGLFLFDGFVSAIFPWPIKALVNGMDFLIGIFIRIGFARLYVLLNQREFEKREAE